jgi:cytochrome c556
MKLKPCVAATSTLLVLAAALPAAAQFSRPESAVKYRKAAMTMMGNHMGRLGGMAKGSVAFDANVAAANADLIATLSKLPYAAFVEGTAGTDKGSAKANIWTERAKFDEAARLFQNEASRLAAAARSGNVDQFKSAFGNTSKACDSCHDSFQNQ